jgi:hypothetical protein
MRLLLTLLALLSTTIAVTLPDSTDLEARNKVLLSLLSLI